MIEQVAVELMNMVTKECTLDDVLAQYKKVMDAIAPTNVLVPVVMGKTKGGRSVPIVQSQDKIKQMLSSSIQQAGTVVTGSTFTTF